MKKLAAIILSLGILFTGFTNVQAEEVNIGTVTYEIYSQESGVISIMNPNPQGGIADVHYKGLADSNLSDGEYTFAVYMDLTKSALIPFNDDPAWFRDSYIYFPENQSYATVEEAEAAAREYAANYVQNYNTTTHIGAYENTQMVFFDPNPIVIEEPTVTEPTPVEEAPTEAEKVKNGNAYGHDKDKAQGKAVGHE